MTSQSYEISSGDLDRVGEATGQLKQRLKRLGVEAGALRRVVIAAYEAEANVVIHARRGAMRATIDTQKVDVEVADQGPGIADIDLAMRPGYSTAPAAARDLGFGAGLGLPNIRKNSDRLDIRSAPGQGVTIRFTVYFTPQLVAGSPRNSVHGDADRCRQCMSCLAACPTQAVRVRAGAPHVLERLCIDCGACIRACDAGALGMETAALAQPGPDAVLVLPAAFLVQFAPSISPQQVLATLAAMGYGRLRLLEEWDRALRAAAAAHASDEATPRPVIAPMCPAVVNLITMRFPSLIGHVGPWLSPVEAAQQQLAECDAVFAAACPCQATALEAGRTHLRLTATDVSTLSAALSAHGLASAPQPAQAAAPEPAQAEADGALRVDGIEHVIHVLEAVENGLVGDVRVLEPYACDGCAFGSPLLRQDSVVARHRWEQARAEVERARGGCLPTAAAVARAEPLAARPSLRLDADMTRAIEKLARIDELTRRLPGRDCGCCGAPTCAAFAEDIVLGRAEIDSCVHRLKREDEPT